MKKYRVIEFFTDLQDNDYPYNAGDMFPRKGMNVSADRIKELSTDANLRGIALIEEVRGAEETVQDATVSVLESAEVPEDAAPVEDEPRKRGRKHKSE